MNQHHKIFYVKQSVNAALETVCKEDPNLFYDNAHTVIANMRPSMYSLQNGSIHSPLLVGSGTEYITAIMMNEEPDNVPLRAKFCRATLRHSSVKTLFGKNYEVPLSSKECPIFGYETHVILQPPTFALGHSAIKIKDFLSQRNIEARLDTSDMR